MGVNVIKIIIIFFLAGCGTQQGREKYLQEIQQKADIDAEARIDSAYAAINHECDSLLVNKVPQMADSIIGIIDAADSLTALQK